MPTPKECWERVEALVHGRWRTAYKNPEEGPLRKRRGKRWFGVIVEDGLGFRVVLEDQLRSPRKKNSTKRKRRVA